MRAEEFSEFVAEQNEKADEAKIDWAEVRAEWLRNLDSFYQRVIDYLRDYIDTGSISYSFAEVPINEENIGSYLARRMDIKIGRQRIQIVPIGTLLIGCKGRVDAIGSAGRAQIILVNAKAKTSADLITVNVTIGATKMTATPRSSAKREPISWAWKIVSSTSPRKFIDVDKEAFLTLLMEIANA